MNDIKRQGVVAYSNGYPLSWNPYDQSTKEGRIFIRGWMNARGQEKICFDEFEHEIKEEYKYVPFDVKDDGSELW